MVIFKKRKQFLILQLIALIAVYIFCISFPDGDRTLFVLIYSLWNLFSYGWLFLAEMKYAPDFHPYQVLSLSCSVFTGLNGIDCYNDLISGENMEYGVYVINDIIYLGLLYLSLQHIILFGGFFFLEKRYVEKNRPISIYNTIRKSNVNYEKFAYIVYAFVWIGRLVSRVLPIEALGTIVATFVVRGHLITLFLLTFALIKSSKNSKAKTNMWLITLIEIIIVLGQGMKEVIIITLIPYCIYMILLYKAGKLKIRTGFVIQLSLIGFFVIGFVFPFVSVFRNISINTGKKWSDITIAETFVEYGKYIFKEGSYAEDDEDRGLDYLMSRAGSISVNAWAIDYAQKNGPTPQFAGYCSMAMIPRIIWPNKPAMVVGGMISELVRGDNTWLSPKAASSYGNSMTLGFIGSGYFSFGFWGAIGLVILHSLFLWWLWNRCRERLMVNPVSLYILTTYIMLVLKDFESYKDCGISFAVTMLACVILSRFTNIKA